MIFILFSDYKSDSCSFRKCRRAQSLALDFCSWKHVFLDHNIEVNNPGSCALIGGGGECELFSVTLRVRVPLCSWRDVSVWISMEIVRPWEPQVGPAPQSLVWAPSLASSHKTGLQLFQSVSSPFLGKRGCRFSAEPWYSLGHLEQRGEKQIQLWKTKQGGNPPSGAVYRKEHWFRRAQLSPAIWQTGALGRCWNTRLKLFILEQSVTSLK